MIINTVSTYENLSELSSFWDRSYTEYSNSYMTTIPDQLFYGMPISTVSFPKCTYIGISAFATAASLRSINFPNVESTGSNAFLRCTSLEHVHMPNLKSGANYLFQHCSALSEITLEACTHLANYTLTIMASLERVYLPECISLGYYPFWSCPEVSMISIPKCTDLGYKPFSSCYKLISLYLTEVSAVPSFSSTTGAFYSCPIGGYSDVAGRLGSVFVPASLYSEFLTAPVWSSYSARIVSV